MLFTVCSAISLILAVAYLVTGADGVLNNFLAFLWLATIASGCVLAVFSRGPRWASFVYLSSVILYGLLHIVSSYLLMIAMGGAMLAMVACGEYKSVKACCDKLCAVADVIKPEPELVVKYEARYQQFKKIYPAVKNLFPEIQ